MWVKLLIVVFYITAGEVLANGGDHSNVFREQDDLGNYAFGYDIEDGKDASNSRQETGGPGHAVGAYSFHDVDGRVGVVEYVADKGGFRAKIKTNEPGTGSIDAAAAIHNGPDPHGFSDTHVQSGSHGCNKDGGYDGPGFNGKSYDAPVYDRKGYN
ncbi:adult-specific rigid cuticular protein 15.7-like protein [Leptotrombidium deliense]|uniref:Adult-specific rigid cuticular protein 15.7-like protein n=1 Tax=Leptotrombidium deliense TaxID=299467 RepID=A0A443S6A3_9ACAR|nr:adult-specific rigid cuticular protein 15.7-like protein [Leptotrombidium deliense]